MRGLSRGLRADGADKDKLTGDSILPDSMAAKLEAAITEKSVIRSIATTIKAYDAPSRIFAKDNDDAAAWVPENDAIRGQDGMSDFTQIPVDSHKLAVIVKLNEDFVNDTAFSIEEHLTDRLAKNFAKGEDSTFIRGAGIPHRRGF